MIYGFDGEHKVEIEGKEVTIYCQEEELDLAIKEITPAIQNGEKVGYSPRWLLT